MLLSVVTGTYRRLDYLRQTLASVRAAVPVGLDYEIVVVDGGSGDGTPEWCAGQSDVRLIQQGELLGAIAAFNAGAEAAQGDYVVLLNDDVRVHPESFVRAIAHLETHPQCGIVAFSDNRRAPGYDTDAYKVQTIRARTRRGTPQDVVYGQVAMVRRWLGRHVQWWDIGDQFNQHTYGGDAALSAKAWELGYSSDEVPGVRIDDLVAPDQLRERNSAIEQERGSAYYRRWPNGPELAHEPPLDNPQNERLRILYAPIYDPGYPHHKQTKRGLREALSKVGLVYEWDYLSDPEPSLAERCAAWQPHLVLLQLHGIDRMTEADLAAARAACPEAVFLNWNGDCYKEHLVSDPMLSLLRHVDLQLVVNQSVLDVYRQHGIRAAYWQVAFEPTDPAQVEAFKARVPAHDVVFLGNAYTPVRKRLGDSLRALRGATFQSLNVGLYGFGWNKSDGSTLYHFDAGTALYQKAAIAIGDNQFPADTGFVSNRLFEALAAGAFLLHQRVNGLEALTGLKAGVHYVEWLDADDLQRQIQRWLTPRHEAQRREIAAAGQAFVRERHSFDARVRELFEDLLPRLEEGIEDEPAQELAYDPL